MFRAAPGRGVKSCGSVNVLSTAQAAAALPIQAPGTLAITQGAQSNLTVSASATSGKLVSLRVDELAADGSAAIAKAEFWNLDFTPAQLSDIPFTNPPVYTTTFDALNYSNSLAPFWPGGQAIQTAARFSGTLFVPTDGAYTFYANSEDGSSISIDGQLGGEQRRRARTLGNQRLGGADHRPACLPSPLFPRIGWGGDPSFLVGSRAGQTRDATKRLQPVLAIAVRRNRRSGGFQCRRRPESRSDPANPRFVHQQRPNPVHGPGCPAVWWASAKLVSVTILSHLRLDAADYNPAGQSNRAMHEQRDFLRDRHRRGSVELSMVLAGNQPGSGGDQCHLDFGWRVTGFFRGLYRW